MVATTIVHLQAYAQMVLLFATLQKIRSLVAQLVKDIALQVYR